jgi:tetratricopeptide (TPR) repeat protein
LITGEVGVGKTRLAQELLRYAQKELQACVLQGQCSELGTRAPYQALLQAVRGYLARQGVEGLRPLSRLHLPVLARWLPELRTGTETEEELPALPPEGERLRFFFALSGLLIHLAEAYGLLLLFLDDLHWADPSTLEFLDHLLLQSPARPLLVLGTYRMEEDKKDPLAPLRRHVVGDLRLERLSEGAIGELLRLKAPALAEGERAHLSRYLHRESGGNPLFLVAILQTLFEEGVLTATSEGHWQAEEVEEVLRRYQGLLPREIHEILRARLERLDPKDRQLLELLSVLGSGEWELLRRLWPLASAEAEGRGGPKPQAVTDLELIGRLERLEQAQLIVSSGGQYGFAHEKIREVTYRGIGRARKRWLHSQVAQALEELYGSRSGYFGSLAHHYARAEQPEKALAFLIPALREAVADGRHAEAQEMCAEARELLERWAAQGTDPTAIARLKFHILKEEVRVYDLKGQRREQEEALRDLLRLAGTGELGDPYEAEAHLLKASFHLKTGDYPEAQLESLKALKVAQEGSLRCRAWRTLALSYLYTGAYEEAQAYLKKAYEGQRAQGTDPGERAETLRDLGMLSWRRGEYERAAGYYREALELLEGKERRQQRAHTLLALGAMYWAQEDPERAIETYREAHRLAAEIGDRQAEAHALGSLGLALWSLGEYEEALPPLREARELHRRIRDRRAEALDLNNLGLVYWSLGDLEEARRHFEEARRIFQEIGWENGEALALNNLGLIHRRQREFERALERHQRALKIHRRSGERRDWGVVLRDLGETHLERGGYSQALELFQEALGISRALGMKEEEMVLLADQGRAYLGLGEIERALASTEEAQRLLEGRPRSPYAPQVLFARFRALQAAGKEGEAQKALQRAYEALWRLAERIRDGRLRESFLTNIPLHREIVRAYRRPSSEPRHREMPSESEEECYRLLRQARWPTGVSCPYCGGREVQRYGRTRNSPEQRYLCIPCRRAFSDRTGTVFAHSNLPLPLLYQALRIVAQGGETEEGKLTQALQTALQASSKTAAKWAKRLRKALQEDELLRRLLPLLS